jgi:hypothetical protein
MSSMYADRWIECTLDEIVIRGYYFPWGTKRIPYEAIRGVKRVDIDVIGKGRIWGSYYSDPRYWASLDPRRPWKKVALILNLGRRVSPCITPDDPDAVEAAIREHANPESTRHDG